MVWGEEQGCRVIPTWVSHSSLQSCLPLAIFFVCPVAIMVLSRLAVAMGVYSAGSESLGDLVTDVIVRVTSSIHILMVKW